MTNSDNGGDNRSYEGNTSLPTVAGSIIPPPDPASRAINAPSGSDFRNHQHSCSNYDSTTGSIAMNLLFDKQLHQFIMKTNNSTL
ncbi:UNVERIFIED_CONTAM: hypothetical protein Sradi_5299400 [Sesamum radiatum]|uniref:Uncharacterized protein n=1 Tax=Sesamum radiatum TaxID=300843 RepID=A0AAW2LPE1_SESRA